MSPAGLIAHLLVLFSLAAPPQAPAPKRSGDLFADIYRRGLAKQRSMTSIRASFTETTVSTLLVKPAVARGTVIAAPPARVRMTYTDPEPKTITMDGTSLVVAWPRRGEREQLDIRETQKRIDRYFTSASLDELKKLFDIKAEPDATIRRANRVTMTPKRRQIKEGLQRLELWIDRETDLLVQMRMSFPGGDQKTIALDDIVIDVPIAADTFRP